MIRKLIFPIILAVGIVCCFNKAMSACQQDDKPAAASDQESPNATPSVTPETPVETGSSKKPTSAPQPIPRDEHAIKIPDTWKRLGKSEIWIDFTAKQVIIGGTICLTDGPLEMFVCPVNTKEHESVIAANALSSELHAALLALEIEPGSPPKWDPAYQAATGPVIDLQVMWYDEKTDKKITRAAKTMVRDANTQKALSHDWVFSGSQIWVDPDTGQKIYYGDSGEMVCVSNFAGSTLDLTVESSQAENSLLFEAFTKNIPAEGTKVYLLLKQSKK